MEFFLKIIVNKLEKQIGQQKKDEPIIGNSKNRCLELRHLFLAVPLQDKLETS